MSMTRILIVLLLALLPTTAPVLAQPAAPAPDITTRQEGERTVREYRINGMLYAIEIRMSGEPAYHLLDRDGSGNFVRREGDSISVPDWVLRTL